VDVLTDALTAFPGTILFISHDPIFLSRVSTRVVEIEDGKARDYYGDYEYYLWKRAQELESIKEKTDDLTPKGAKLPKAKATSRPASPPPPVHQEAQGLKGGERRELTKNLARLEKQVVKAEADIADLEARIKARDQDLADPTLYQDFARWNDLHQEQDRWKVELERMTGKWEALGQELEGVRRQLTVRGLG
jgi:ATP-binding cassette subfamily F protein 3